MTTEQPDGGAAQQVRRLEARLARERAARRETEQIAEDALRRLHEANEMKGLLLGVINHELRTPATIVKGFAHQLTAGWDVHDDAARRDMLERIGRAAEALADLVEDVLELAGLEAGHVAEEAEEIDLPALVADVVDDDQVEVDGEDVALHAHPGAVRRVLQVLLDNAQRYGPAGAAVRVRWWSEDGDVAIEVVDRGPGVPVEERRRVFEPFYRGTGEHVTRTSGVGTGLAVAQRLVALHGGDVRVDDAEPHGACFTVRFPVPTVADGGARGTG